MEEFALRQPELVGREEELSTLKSSLDKAIAGKGSTVLISGEPGVGKTRLLEEFKKQADANKMNVLAGASVSTSAHPFLMFAKALDGVIAEPLFEEQEHTSFAEIFAVNKAGLLLAKASSETEAVDADIFAGMLSAVQDFVKDSLDNSGDKKAGLGRLEYGDMKILIEHGQHLFLTAIFKGGEHPDMKNTLKHVLQKIETVHGVALEKWDGKIADMRHVQEEISFLASTRFLVRKDLEGVKLDNERTRIANRVLDLVQENAKTKPVILILEDLHWADESSLFVFRFLARNIGNVPVLVLATTRPSEGPESQKALAAIKEDSPFTEIPLSGLELSEVKTLMDSCCPKNDFPVSFAERLHRDCAGNPFFISELLRQMREEGAIVLKEGMHSLSRGDYAMPTSIDEMVQRRLDSLEPDAMVVAEYASCMGREFDVDAVLSLGTLSNPRDALEKLKASGIVLFVGEGAEFSHAYFQSVTYSNISSSWKSAYHKSLGEHYELAYAGRLGDVVYELAKHYLRTNLHEKGFDYSTQAAEKAESSFAIDHALEMYSSALAALPKIRDKTRLRLDCSAINERMGDLHSLTGNMEKGIKAYESAQSTGGSPEIKARTTRKRVTLLRRKGEFEAALASEKIGESLIGSDSLEFWRLKAELARTLIDKGELDRGIDMCRTVAEHLARFENARREVADIAQAIGLALYKKGDMQASAKQDEIVLQMREEIGDQYGMAQIYSNMGIGCIMRGDLSGATAQFQKAIALQEKLKDSYGLARTYSNLAGVYYYKAEWDMVQQITEKSLAIKKRIGDAPGVTTSLDILGLINIEKGEISKALQYFEESLVIKERLGDKRALAEAYNYRGNAYLALGIIDKAMADHERSLALRKEMGDKVGIAASLNNLGDTMRESGDMPGAEKKFHESMELSGNGVSNELYIDSLLSLSSVQILTGRFSEAAANLDAAEKLIKEANLAAKEPLRQRLLGMLQASKGEMTIASEHFESAIKTFTEAKSEFDLAVTRATWGEMLVENGQADKGRELLQTALHVFEKAGSTRWMGRCRKVLGEL